MTSIPESRSVRLLPRAFAGLWLLAACSPPDHEHEPQESAAQELPAIGVTVFTATHLLYLEFAPLLRGEETRFLAHFTDLASGEPVRSGRVVLEATGPEGSILRAVAEQPARDGLFIPLATPASSGVHQARLVLETEGAADVFALGALQVHENLAAAAAAPAPPAAADALPFLLEQQWKVGVLLHEVRMDRLVPRVPAAARVVLPDGAMAEVRPSLAGILEGPAQGKWPQRGESVTAGQVVGFVAAILDTATRAQLEAFRLELDLKLLDAEQRLVHGGTRARAAQRELERIQRLAADGLRSPQQLELAEQELFLAQNELDAASALRAAVTALHATADPAGASIRLPLVAPVAGVIEASPRALGEFVGPESVLLRIVDADRLWLEARVSEFDLSQLDPEAGGELLLDAAPDRPYPLTPAAGARFLSASTTLDPDSRTATLLFEFPAGAIGPKPGMRGTMRLAAAAPREALLVPEAALVFEAGVPTAYVILGGESFQKRILTLGERDAGFVEVLNGLSAGERVVTRGASMVRLASLTPAAFGPGHAH